MQPQEYYSNEEVQKELFRLTQGREVQVWFGKIPGKRPEHISYLGDIKDLAKSGMTSIHISEERWKDLNKLKAGLSKKDLNENRKGWDCVLDLDSKHLPYALTTAKFIIEALKFHNVTSYDFKYSGNNGVHIAIPFEAFPKEVNNIEIKNFFPGGVRVIAEYIKSMIKEHLAAELLRHESITQIAQNAQTTEEKLAPNGHFDPFKAVDIDSVLISNRHLFRCAYSMHEKSGLVSIPLNSIEEFNKQDAKPENVKHIRPFLNKPVPENDAYELVVQALDWQTKKAPIVEEKKEFKNVLPNEPLGEQVFPPCIHNIHKGIPDDGRKRAVFLYINFLINMGWSYEEVEKRLEEWNKNNHEQLKEGYIKAQLAWFKKQKDTILPPNCTNDMYYKGIGVCTPDGLCKKIKNPVQYAKRKAFLNTTFKKTKKKKKAHD